MALKKTVTADEFKKLPADIQKEYVKEGDDYKLDVEGGLDSGVEEMRRARDNEKKEVAAAKKLLKEAQDAMGTLQHEHEELLRGNIPKADLAKLEKSYQEKIAKIESDAKAKIDGLDGNVKRLLVDNVATTLATELSSSPSLLLPHIKGRLVSEMGSDGVAVTRVLDKEGKLSAATLDDLKKEIIATKEFSPIITASKGSGGGANRGQGGGGASSTGGKVDFTKGAKSTAQQLRDRGLVTETS